MIDATAFLARLPRSAFAGAEVQERRPESVVSTGVPKLDTSLHGGLAQAALHEIYAAREGDAPATTGLALAFAHRLARSRPVVWVRREFIDTEVGQPYQPGLAGFGLDPAALTFVRARTPQETLQAGLEAARCNSLGVVLIELWGETKALDLAASRRLVLAAKASGVTVLMTCAVSTPQPSAAETRWQVRAAPSRALLANAPGNPSFSVTLLRQRSGAGGQEWYLEWNCDRGCFEDRPLDGATVRPNSEPPLSGALVSVSLDRPGAIPASQGGVGSSFRKTG
jgi:protein ImuA